MAGEVLAVLGHVYIEAIDIMWSIGGWLGYYSLNPLSSGICLNLPKPVGICDKPAGSLTGLLQIRDAKVGIPNICPGTFVWPGQDNRWYFDLGDIGTYLILSQIMEITS